MDAWNDKNQNEVETFDALTADEAPENDNLPGESFESPGAGTELETPGTDIVVPDEEPEESERAEEEQKVTRFGRAIEVLNDEVTNIVRVVVDEDDNVVGYWPEAGFELIVVPDDSMISIGWIRIDGEFVDPEADV